MDNYNYSPNGIDYDPDLLYGGNSPAPAPRKKTRQSAERPQSSQSSRQSSRQAEQGPERPVRQRAQGQRQRQRPDYDSVATREEMARRDRQRRERDNEARLERARLKEKAEKARREEIAAERAAERRIRDAERAAEKARRAAERERNRKESKPLMESGFVKFFKDKRTHAFFGVALICIAVYLLVAAISFVRTGAADQSAVTSHTVSEITSGAAKVENTGGPVGAVVARLVFAQGLGLGSLTAIVYLVILGLGLMGIKKCNFWSVTFKSLLVAVSVSIVAGLIALSTDSEILYGGIHGKFINEFLVTNVEWVGALLVSLLMIVAVIYVYLNDFIGFYNKYKAFQKARREKEEQIRLEREEAQARVIAAMQNSALEGNGDEAAEGTEENNDNPSREHRDPISVGFDENVDEYTDEYAIDYPDAAETREQAESQSGQELPREEAEADFSGQTQDEQNAQGMSDSMEPEPAGTENVADGNTDVTGPVAGREPAFIEPSAEEVNPALAAALTGELTDEHLRNPQAHAPAALDGGVTSAVVAMQPEAVPVAAESPAPAASPAGNIAPAEAVKPSATDGQEAQVADGPEFDVKTNEIETADPEHIGADTLYDPTAELSRYRRPGCDLLNIIEQPAESYDITEQEANKDRIIKALAQFDIEITKIDATVGPTVTLYEIVPAEGTRIAKIKRLEDDIAMTLSAKGIRIIAPIPGKSAVGIEVPNHDSQTVSIHTILSSKAFQECKYELPMAMGATITNQVYIANLADMPHILVAGATGQGKSVGLNTIIASLLYKKHPAELKFVLIDPKRVEFSLYNSLERHFLAKLPDEEDAIVTNMDNVVRTLNSLCVEMERRYDLLKDAHVVKVTKYNELFIQKKLNPEKGHRYLPYIVIIVDEFADLIMTAGKQVETPIARIAQMARAVGMHMIIATQRPSTNVITGLIKANFPGRVAFRVNQMVDSRTILDCPGANQLIGKGDMLFSHNGAMERVQCAYIDTKEVHRICDFIDNQAGYPHAYFLPEPVGEEAENAFGGSNGNLTDRDPLFEEAAQIIVQTGVASTSSLQRRYSIGYNRAGKIMDQLEAAGIVGPATGGKARSVLVDTMQLGSILNSRKDEF